MKKLSEAMPDLAEYMRLTVAHDQAREDAYRWAKAGARTGLAALRARDATILAGMAREALRRALRSA